MSKEAQLVKGELGLVPETDGWFVVNASEARWCKSEHFGSFCGFEGKPRFPQIGVNIHVLQPGLPACKYHSENQQENFLVLSGECRLIIEEQERRLKAWDFVHCPPGTKHVFVGAGDGPCVVLMIGYRSQEEELLYPVSELADKYGAAVETETDSPKEAYAGPRDMREIEAPWPLA